MRRRARSRDARLALGGVAHKPWRGRQAEALLHRQAARRDELRGGGRRDRCASAKRHGHNAFKIELARRAIVRALRRPRGHAAVAADERIDKSSTMRYRHYVGTPISRVDGRAKVTGGASTPPSSPPPDLAYGCVVSSTIAKGRIAQIDTAAALAVPGVLAVITHENRPRCRWLDAATSDEVAPPGSPFRPLHDDEIHYSGQPVALVVAETFERALRRDAGARRVRRRGARRPTSERSAAQAYAPEGSATACRRRTPARRRRRRRSPTPPCRSKPTTAPGRAPQPDGAARHDRRLGRRRQAHPLRQDAVGRRTCSDYVCSVFGLAQDDVRVFALRRRRLRLGAAAAIPASSWRCWRRAS